MSNSEWDIDFQTSITIPTGATTGPRIVIGDVIPQVLLTWAALNGVTIAAVILKYWNTTDFVWDAVGTFSGLNCNFRGTFDTINGVYVVDRIVNIDPGGPQPLEWAFGSASLNPKPLNIPVLFSQVVAQNNVGLPGRLMVATNTVTAEVTNNFFGFTQANESISGAAGVYSDINQGYGRVGPAITFVKDYDNTDIEVHNHNTCFVSAAGIAVQFGLKVFSGPSNVGNIYDMNALFFNVANQHLQSSITRCLGFGLGTFAQGTYVFIPQWKKTIGGAGLIVTMDTQDFSSLQLREVAGENHS